MKSLYTLIGIFFFSIVVSAQNVTTSVIQPPSQLRCNDVPAKLNNVVFGAIPPNSQDKPVIVFVHGWFDNGYSWFMANNKWYEKAYNEGYRTAYFFHSFSDAFQKNGKVVAEMIRKTCQHYNTNNVVAVCHSKGGIDMEWALYNENVWDSIAGVVTLSTPYYGAPLIDVISNPIIRLITENIPFIGPIFKGQGTYQLQPAYMAGVVRPMMDNNQYNRPEKFHSFSGTGLDHRTVLPASIPDDALKIIFPTYNPICINLPGFGAVLGDLMTAGMVVTGNITRIVPVQPRYNNPQRNTTINDGLVPYYSGIRPGSVVVKPPTSPQAYLSHIDELFSWYTWDIVKPEVEYFKDHPVFRTIKSNIQNQPTEQETEEPVVSNMQFIQSNNIAIQNTNKLYVVGEYKDVAIKVLDENNNLVKTINLNNEVTSLYSIFNEIDLSKLPANKVLTLQSSVPLIGLLNDGKNATVSLNTQADKTYFSNEALGFEVSLNDWSDNIETIVIKGYLNRNMNENGEVIWDKVIPVSFVFDNEKQLFVCKDKLDLESGIYNLSIYADGNTLKRFATTSVLVKQERKQNTDSDNLFSVFPNPANDAVTVQFNATENNNYSIEVFDMLGKKLIEKNFKNIISGSQQIQFSTDEYNLSKGAYLISLNINGERKNCKVLVLN
jgi:triacylglycerol esterase/lipase EstA (alpha/beta hydrolase family)